MKLPQMNFFSKNNFSKNFQVPIGPFHSAKFLQKFLWPIQSYEDVPFSDPKWSTCDEQNFFGTNRYYYFHLPIGPFNCAKFKNILTEDPELRGCAICGPKMVHLPQAKTFFGKLLKSLSSTYQPLSLCKILKKFFLRMQTDFWDQILPVDERMRDFWAQNGPSSQMRIFFRKPVHDPCFFHSCLFKSKIKVRY